MTDPFRDAWIADNPPPQFIAEYDGLTGETVERELSEEEYEARADAGATAYQTAADQAAENQVTVTLETEIIGAQPVLTSYADALEQPDVPTPVVPSTPTAGLTDELPANAPNLVPDAEFQQMVSDLMRLVNGLITTLTRKGYLQPGEVVPQEPAP